MRNFKNYERCDILAMGRVLFDHKLWGELRKHYPEKAKDSKSRLERNNSNIDERNTIFSKLLIKYLETVANKDKEIKNLEEEINMAFKDIIDSDFENLTEEERKNLEFNLSEYIKR